MRKYVTVRTEDLIKLLEAFTDEEEYLEFSDQLDALAEELKFISSVVARNVDKKEFATVMLLKKLFIMGLFCKDNIEVIKCLIKEIEYKEISLEQKERLSNEFPDQDFDRTIG